MPEISVIMSVFKENPDYLKQAIESILKQTFTDFEFLIIDDGAPEEIYKILENYAANDSRILLLKNTLNKGLTKSLNFAIQNTKGEYIARMDSDDIAIITRLEQQLSYLKQDSLSLLGAGCFIINSKGKTIREEPGKNPKPLDLALLKGNFFIHSTLFGTKRVFLELYNESFLRSQDYEFLLRVLKKGYRIGNVPESLLFYRKHTGNISSKNSKVQEWYALKARWLAISKYNYSLFGMKYIFRSFFILLIPYRLKYWILMRK